MRPRSGSRRADVLCCGRHLCSAQTWWSSSCHASALGHPSAFASIWSGLSHPHSVAKNREWSHRGGREWSGILWETVPARGNREERCRVHSLSTERRELPFAFAHSTRAFHADQR